MFLLFLSLFFRTAEIHATNPRSVNLELETSLLFQPGDKNQNSIIDKVKNFIEQIQNAIVPVQAFLRTSNDTENESILTRFLEQIANAVLKYDDNDLKDFAGTFIRETELFIEENGIFFEDNVKQSLLSTLKYSLDMTPRQIRVKVKKTLDNTDLTLANLVGKLNVFYNESDHIKMEKTLKNIDSYPEIHKNLRRIIRELLSVTFYDKYHSFNKTLKDDFVKQISEVQKYINSGNARPHSESHKQSTAEKSKGKLDQDGSSQEDDQSDNDNEITIKKDVEINVKGVKRNEDKTVGDEKSEDESNDNRKEDTSNDDTS